MICDLIIDKNHKGGCSDICYGSQLFSTKRMFCLRHYARVLDTALRWLSKHFSTSF